MQNPREPGVGNAGASCLVGSGDTNNYSDPILTNQPADSARLLADWRRDFAKNDEPRPVSVITQHAGGISHTYTLTNERPYRNRHGRETRILTWRGTCGVCGEPFSITSPPKPSRYMTRTCPKHRGQR